MNRVGYEGLTMSEHTCGKFDHDQYDIDKQPKQGDWKRAGDVAFTGHDNNYSGYKPQKTGRSKILLEGISKIEIWPEVAKEWRFNPETPRRKCPWGEYLKYFEELERRSDNEMESENGFEMAYRNR